MDRKLMWIYMDRLMAAQPSQTSTTPRWEYSLDIDSPKEHRIYLALCNLGLVEIFMMPHHPWLQATPTHRGASWWRSELKSVISRKHHALAYRIRRMRKYVDSQFHFHYCSDDWDKFQRRHALYLNSPQEREAAKRLATSQMIQAVEAYEKNPMFDPLQRRWSAVVRRDNMVNVIKSQHGMLIRHLRDLKGSRLP